MASSGKKRTTMAKLNRENKLRERRLDKQERREARKNAPQPDPFADPSSAVGADATEPVAAQAAPDALVQSPADA
jgi:hypothetical protein